MMGRPLRERRGLAVALGLVGWAALGCNTTPPTTPGDLVTPTSMAISGSELFIASTNSDELRVLALSSDVTTRQFENAPNPLYVLSVPVVTRPIALATSTNAPDESSYVYALSTVAARLGVVQVANKIELAEIPLPGVPLSLASWTNTDDGSDTVYVGTTQGQHGFISEVHVPPPNALDAGALDVQLLVDLGQSTPAALAISPDGTTLAVGDSQANEAATPPVGGLLLLEGLSTASASADGGSSLSFNRVLVGGPVEKVVYSPESSDPGTGAVFPAGQYLYALIGGAGCPNEQPCSGVQVVTDGQALQVAPGQMAVPIQVPGAPLDVAVGGRGFPDGGPVAYPVVGLPSTVGGAVQVALVLGITATDGNVYMADGVNARLFDTSQVLPTASDFHHFNPDGTSLSELPDAGFATLPDGGQPPYPVFEDGGEDLSGPDTTSIQLSKGAVRNEAINVVYNGTIPGLTQRFGSVSGGGVLIDPTADFAAFGAQVGDEVDLTGATDLSCPTSGFITVMGPNTGAGLTVGEAQLYIPGLSPTCYPSGTIAQYTVRVFGVEPYAVVGEQSGLLGRTNVGELFQGPATYFYRPPDYDPLEPGISFFMLPTGDPRIDAGWSFVTTSGVAAFAATPSSGLTMPANIVWPHCSTSSRPTPAETRWKRSILPHRRAPTSASFSDPDIWCSAFNLLI
jgi:hypothetical protein